MIYVMKDISLYSFVVLSSPFKAKNSIGLLLESQTSVLEEHTNIPKDTIVLKSYEI